MLLCREAWRRLVPFLNVSSVAHLEGGNSPAQLSAAEGVLGQALPWHLWELLRYRGGQAPGPGVDIVDGGRLLRQGTAQGFMPLEPGTDHASISWTLARVVGIGVGNGGNRLYSQLGWTIS